MNLPASGGGAGGQPDSAVNSHPIHYTYDYDTAGQLTKILDQSLGQATQYTYDLAGNRVREPLSQKTLLAGTDVQTDVQRVQAYGLEGFRFELLFER